MRQELLSLATAGTLLPLVHFLAHIPPRAGRTRSEEALDALCGAGPADRLLDGLDADGGAFLVLEAILLSLLRLQQLE